MAEQAPLLAKTNTRRLCGSTAKGNAWRASTASMTAARACCYPISVWRCYVRISLAKSA